jgi:hypothetical protein
MINFIKVRAEPGFGATSAMNHMSNAGKRLSQTLGIVDRAGANLHSRKVMIQKTTVASDAQQNCASDITRAQAIQDMTADKSTGACE